MNWINCKEQMPEVGERVIPYNGVIDFIEIGVYDDNPYNGEYGSNHYEMDDGCIVPADQISHWMPLPPEPAKEAKHD